jgi:RNA recognition motif-containing protein
MTLYVGNLPFKVTESELQELFGQFGEVQSVKLISDAKTGRKKGFGFIDMENDAAMKAISELNETEFGGRTIKVNEARNSKPRGN